MCSRPEAKASWEWTCPYLPVCVCGCDLGMTSLADAYHCACLALVFVFRNREEQVCVWCVSGARHTHTVTCCLSVCSFVLAVCRPLFFISCFPSVTCLSNSPPVRPVLICALLCVITAYLFVQSWSKRKKTKQNSWAILCFGHTVRNKKRRIKYFKQSEQETWSLLKQLMNMLSLRQIYLTLF